MKRILTVLALLAVAVLPATAQTKSFVVTFSTGPTLTDPLTHNFCTAGASTDCVTMVRIYHFSSSNTKVVDYTLMPSDFTAVSGQPGIFRSAPKTVPTPTSKYYKVTYYVESVAQDATGAEVTSQSAVVILQQTPPIPTVAIQ